LYPSVLHLYRHFSFISVPGHFASNYLPLVHFSDLYTLPCSTSSELSLTHCQSFFAHTQKILSRSSAPMLPTSVCVPSPMHAASSLCGRPRTKSRRYPKPRNRAPPSSLSNPCPCQLPRPTHNMRQPRAEAEVAQCHSDGASDSSISVCSLG
jgi:hypothetical protein